MFSCTLVPANEQRPAVLEVSGEASIQYIQQFKTALLDGLRANPDLMVDCSKITLADASCLQLLCSAHLTYQAMTLAPQASPVLQELAEASGMNRFHGCCLANEKPCCIWAREN